MSFLKRLGTVLAKGVQIAVGIGPLIAPFMGSAKTAEVVANDLTSIGQLVVQAEALLQANPGPDKLQAVTPLVASILRTSQLVDGKQIQNETLFTEAARDIASGVAKLLNSIHPDEVKTA
jgi:hypothetical protein